MIRLSWAPGLIFAVLATGCAVSSAPAASSPSPTPSTIAAPSPTPAPSPTQTASPTPDPQPTSWDIRVRHLTIPSIGINAEVSGSQTVPDTSVAPPGCPAPPVGQETLTVPASGIATPEQALQGIENTAWIFGHSRWQSQPGLFHALQGIAVGDELLVDGMDRRTGEDAVRQRFVVDGIYLADKESGAALLATDGPTAPTVVLQTSVREAGASKQWLLDREQILARASNVVEGDLEDPCKYLLLFVIARGS
jgi:hypothetical protein